jgi:hypothetical protein
MAPFKCSPEMEPKNKVQGQIENKKGRLSTEPSFSFCLHK